MKKIIRNLTTVFILFLLVGCASLTTQKSLIPLDPAVESGQLENGFRYQLRENNRPENRIFINFSVRAGSLLEEDDQKGIAHLIEHMAFNGTEHFEHRKIVEYFENIGMGFGPEINAYTSYENTYYQLEIPADDPQILETTLLILRDWADGIAFDPEELEKERGVVLEEWRSGRGTQGRALDALLPELFAGSRYAERLPIGDPDIVRTISRERIIDFYEDWYTPDRMCLSIAGSFNTEEMVQKIEENFSGIVSLSDRQEESFSIPEPEEIKVALHYDSELSTSSIEIFERIEEAIIHTRDDLKQQIIRNMALDIYRMRLGMENQQADPVYLSSTMSMSRMAIPAWYRFLLIQPSQGRFTEALAKTAEELARLKQHGVLWSELEQEKTDMIAGVDQYFRERSSRNSADYAAEMLNYELYGTRFFSPETYLELYQQILPEITVEDVNTEIAHWYSSPGQSILCSIAPADRGQDSEELIRIWTESLATETEPKSDSSIGTNALYPDTEPTGTIESEVTLIPSDFQRLNLSNGAEVYFLQSDYTENTVLFNALSPGGYSMLEDEEYFAGYLATAVLADSGLAGYRPEDLDRILAGKNLQISPWINDNNEGFSGSSATGDLETLFQLIHLHFTHPDFSGIAFDSLMYRLRNYTEERLNNPQEIFQEEKGRLLTQNHYRSGNFTPDILDAIDLDTVETIYRQRFADAGDFSFIFVGNFNPDEIRRLSEIYLAGLPTENRKEEPIDRGIEFPQQPVEQILEIQQEPKSTVFLACQNEITPSPEEEDLSWVMEQYLNTELNNLIREELSGTYGIGLALQIDRTFTPSVTTMIQFDCEPGREDELTGVIENYLSDWITGEFSVSQDSCNQLKNRFRRTWEEQENTDAFWMNNLLFALDAGLPLNQFDTREAVYAQITPENLRQTAERYFNPRFIRLDMRPQP